MPNDTNFFWATLFILYDPLELSTGACPTPSGTEIVKTHHCEVKGWLNYWLNYIDSVLKPYSCFSRSKKVYVNHLTISTRFFTFWTIVLSLEPVDQEFSMKRMSTNCCWNFTIPFKWFHASCTFDIHFLKICMTVCILWIIISNWLKIKKVQDIYNPLVLLLFCLFENRQKMGTSTQYHAIGWNNVQMTLLFLYT